MFLEHQSEYYNDFLRIMRVKTGVMMLEIQLCHHRNKLYFTIIK